jgi:hypothetical protein
MSHRPASAAAARPDAATLERIATELMALARSAAAFDVPDAPASTPGSAHLAPRIRSYLAGRRAREAMLGEQWFADPAWDMLLDLLACHLERRRVTVTSACIAAAVPPTTALRWLDRLVKEGAVLRAEDPEDRRKAYVKIGPEMAARMIEWAARHLPPLRGQGNGASPRHTG